MNQKSSQSEPEKGASLARKQKQFTVSASPLNAVKLDLGIILFLAIVVAVVVLYTVPGDLDQILILAAFGLVAMAWLVFRARRVLRQYDPVQESHEA